MKAGIKAGVAFVMDGQEVASVCVAPLKGRDRAVEKAGNMPIGPDKDRTEGPAIAWVHRFDYDASEMHEGRSTSKVEVHRAVGVARSRLRLAAVHGCRS